VQMDAVNRYSKTNYPVAATLFFEFHGFNERHAYDQAAFVESLTAEHGGSGFQWATRLEDREKLWDARHAALYASLALRPGSKGFVTDVCVPISRLSECILQTLEDKQDAPFPATLVGHVGDGNFHMVCMLDPSSQAETDVAHRLMDRMVTRALSMGGTCTGEHGIGFGKMKYMAAEHGAAVDVMRAIKRALDPDNRMNPGKMILP
jgi:D-lactate dehydrogenase (cytochrome)